MPAPGDSASKIKADRARIYGRADLSEKEKAQEYAIYSEALRRKRKGKKGAAHTEGAGNLSHLTVVPLFRGRPRKDSANRALRASVYLRLLSIRNRLRRLALTAASRAAWDESKHPRGQPGNPGTVRRKGRRRRRFAGKAGARACARSRMEPRAQRAVQRPVQVRPPRRRRRVQSRILCRPFPAPAAPRHGFARPHERGQAGGPPRSQCMERGARASAPARRRAGNAPAQGRRLRLLPVRQPACRHGHRRLSRGRRSGRPASRRQHARSRAWPMRSGSSRTT